VSEMSDILQWVAIVCLLAMVAYLIAVEYMHYKITRQIVEVLKVNTDILEQAARSAGKYPP
jgi:hypothetical protein